MSWASWLLALIGPLAAKALLYLGITVLTFTGVDAAFGAVVNLAKSSYGGMPAAILGLCAMAGVPQALGIIFGAFNARLAMWLASSASRWVVAKP